ncbi:hypothetical protein TEA_014398 [Camellia sinensis var. sinensis]|uniref:FANCL C-terminal domain-containing protein n=1 Tax=Camellia sinensis var. sinensis TaxID=542762 RepID=A0A4S4DNA8_CAMSN|nr:hypothetical protein TEA_014398 [Camellia sinensis var. sinensis]
MLSSSSIALHSEISDEVYVILEEFMERIRCRELASSSSFCSTIYSEHLGKLEEFWSTLDSIDQSLLVVDPEQAHHATAYRLINLGNDCFLMLLIDALDPRSLPECRFIGSDPKVKALRQVWRRNCKRWMKNKTLPENLAITLETQLPGPPNIQKNDQQIECGICYAQCLPIDDELGAKSGSGTDYTCDNSNCSRAFHSLCLGDWLRSITTTRQWLERFAMVIVPKFKSDKKFAGNGWFEHGEDTMMKRTKRKRAGISK